MQKALADDFPFDLPQLIDGVAPNKKKMKNVLGFFFFSTIGKTNSSADKHAIISLSYKRSLTTHAHTRTHTNTQAHNLSPSLDQTHAPTYVAAVVTDGEEGLICQSVGAGPIAVGWWMADGGAAGVQRKQLVPCWSLLFSSALHPSLIPCSLSLILSTVVPVNHCLSLPIPSGGQFSWSRRLTEQLDKYSWSPATLNCEQCVPLRVYLCAVCMDVLAFSQIFSHMFACALVNEVGKSLNIKKEIENALNFWCYCLTLFSSLSFFLMREYACMHSCFTCVYFFCVVCILQRYGLVCIVD